MRKLLGDAWGSETCTQGSQPADKTRNLSSRVVDFSSIFFQESRSSAACPFPKVYKPPMAPPGSSGSHVAHVEAFLQATAQPRTLRLPTDAPGSRWRPGGPPHGVQQAVAAANVVLRGETNELREEVRAWRAHFMHISCTFYAHLTHI